MSEEELATQARKVVRSNVVTRSFVVFVTFWVVAGVGLLTVLTVQNYHRGVENKDTLHELATQSALIKSCTTPGMPCFAEAQKRTGQAVASINQVIVLAAACAIGKTGTVPQIEIAIQNCVIDRLAAEKKGNP